MNKAGSVYCLNGVSTVGGQDHFSTRYQSLLARHDPRCSMSSKGNCYDNACAESFFHSLKVEAIHGERFATREVMRRHV